LYGFARRSFRNSLPLATCSGVRSVFIIWRAAPARDKSFGNRLSRVGLWLKAEADQCLCRSARLGCNHTDNETAGINTVGYTVDGCCGACSFGHYFFLHTSVSRRSRGRADHV
jgi:hypothetical protein